jgi:prophage regulatory protein
MKVGEVERVTSHHRTTLTRWIARNHFPKPISIGNRRVGWLKSDIDQWLKGCWFPNPPETDRSSRNFRPSDSCDCGK